MPNQPTDNPSELNIDEIVPPDPFDARPAIVIRPSEQDKSVWGISVALGMAAAMGAFAWMIAKIGGHQTTFAILGCLLGIFLTALTANAFNTPPATIALNVATRRYQVIKGSGRFRKNFKGGFDEIEGVAVKVEESSHGISGYTIMLKIGGKAGLCTVDKLGPRDAAKANERAAKLASAINVAVLPDVRGGKPK